jgi:hypothetical protein
MDEAAHGMAAEIGREVTDAQGPSPAGWIGLLGWTGWGFGRLAGVHLAKGCHGHRDGLGVAGGHQQQYEQMLIKENHHLREQYEVRDALVMLEL